ncbi:MAG: hypothetical protein KF712_07150 [Akkermansiaceae bacterium]|nr:hypothetical protein [Akkermansiaceae bacterium]
MEQLALEDVRRFLEEDRNQPRDRDPVADARRTYQRQLLLSRLPADILAELTATMLDGTDGNRNSAAVLSAWARKDWKAALAWVDGSRERSRWASSVIGVLALTDPSAAEDLFKERMATGDPEIGFNGVYPVAMAKARQGSRAFLDFIDQLPSQQQTSMISNALRELPKEELAVFVEQLGQRNFGGDSSWVHSNAFAELMRKDPEAADVYLRKLEPGPMRTRLEASSMAHLATAGKTEEFGAMLRKSFEGIEEGKEKAHVQHLAGNLINQLAGNPDLLEKFRESLPPGFQITAEDLSRNGNSLLWGDPNGTVNRAKLLRTDGEQADYLVKTFGQSAEQLEKSQGVRLNEVDLSILEKRVQAMNFTGDAKERVDASMAAFREALLRKRNAPK